MRFCRFPSLQRLSKRGVRSARTLGSIALLCAGSSLAFPQQATPPELTIEEAVTHALARNTSYAEAQFETRRAEADLAANRTKRYLSSSITGQGSQLITQPQITFAQGSLGTYPTIGPIPGTNTTVTIPRNFTGIVSASASQPLTTLFRLHFQLKALAEGVAGTKQDELKQRLLTVDSVRRAYYAVVEAQAEADSVKASLPLYRESVRLATENGKQETILQADLLRSKAQLLQTENSMSEAEDAVVAAEEKLNDLMGRDIHTAFRVTAVPEVDDQADSEETLEAKAIQNRPDIKKAQLDISKADLDLRAKKAEYIPDVSGSVSYYTTFNFGNTLPSNIGLAGLSLNWEPWDWGRKTHEIAEKRALANEAKASASETERSARIEVSTSWRQLQSARRQVALSEANQLAARENLRELQEQVQREEKLPKDLFRAQSDLAAADSQRQKALTAFWKARADLKKVTGEE